MNRALGWSLAVALALGFSALGFWQLNRGLDKRDYLVRWDAAIHAAPTSLLPWRRGAKIDRPEAVSGRLQPLSGGRWWLLDHARHQGRLGVRAYFVARVRPDLGLLVDAGWLPFDRARGLPELPPLPAEVEVRGLLLPWPGQGIALGASVVPPPGRPALLARLDRATVAADAGLPLVDGVLRLGPDASFGFARELEALPNTLTPEKHFGYAAQWWGLALASLVTAWVLDRRRQAT